MVLGLVIMVQVAVAEVPSLVTLSQGEVLLLNAAGEAPAPPAPFALKPGERLRLAEGASAVVLHQGLARRFIGPTVADPAAQAAPVSGLADPGVSALMSRQADTARAGASRAQPSDFALLRPVPEDELVRLPEVTWACPADAGGCPESEVSIAPFMGGSANLWEGRGAGRVAPELDSLPVGPLVIRIGDRSFMVQGATEARQTELRSFLAYAEGASSELAFSEQASTVASLLWPLGFRTEALWYLDRAADADPEEVAGFAELLSRYERLAGVSLNP